jgi:hypothetical protein
VFLAIVFTDGALIGVRSLMRWLVVVFQSKLMKCETPSRYFIRVIKDESYLYGRE